jgi:hypothetical protein
VLALVDPPHVDHASLVDSTHVDHADVDHASLVDPPQVQAVPFEVLVLGLGYVLGALDLDLLALVRHLSSPFAWMPATVDLTHPTSG